MDWDVTKTFRQDVRIACMGEHQVRIKLSSPTACIYPTLVLRSAVGGVASMLLQ